MNLKSKYLSSAVLLLLTSVIVKIIGAFYKIPMTAYIGAVGRGYFATAYNICLPIHALIMGAFPVALSRITSKYNAKGDTQSIGLLKAAADKLFLKVGLIGMLVMLLLAKPYCDYIASSPKSSYSVLVLAPSILFSALASSYRGYYEGFMNMRPTSVSQTIEALFKLVFGLAFAKLSMAYLYNYYIENGAVLGKAVETEQEALSLIYPITSAGAMLGVTLGCALSLLYVYIYHRINKPDYCRINPVNTKSYQNELMSFSFPIMVSCAVQSVFQFLDTASVQGALSLISKKDLISAYSESISLANTASEDVVSHVYGILSTALDFKNLIPGITMALGICAVPAVSRAFEAGEREHLNTLINSIYKYTAVISIGGGVIIALCSKDILSFFYSSSAPDIVISGESLVKAFAITVPVYSLAGVAVFCVQAIGVPKKSIAPFVGSGIIRVVLNILLVSNEDYILFGNVISGAVSYFIILLWNSKIVKNAAKIKISFKNVYFKPIIIGSISYFSMKYAFESIVLTSNLLFNLLIEFALFGALFCMLCFLFKVLIFKDVFCVFKTKKNGLNT